MVKFNKFYYDKMLFDQSNEVSKSAFNDPNFRTGSSDAINASALGGFRKKERLPEDEKAVLDMLRYALEYYLEWTPQYAKDHLTEEILTKLHLRSLVRSRLGYPAELAGDDSPWIYYLICRAYPKLFTYDETDAVISYYEKNYIGTPKYGKSFFTSTEEGIRRAKICLWYAIQNYQSFLSVADMYRFFVDSRSESEKWLKDMKLFTHCDENYESPVEFLHASIPENMDDLGAYNEAVFNMMNQQKTVNRKKKPIK